MLSIKPMKLETFVYTPYELANPQNFPNDVIPTMLYMQ